VRSRLTIEDPHRVLHQGPGTHYLRPTRPFVVSQADQLLTLIDLMEEEIRLKDWEALVDKDKPRISRRLIRTKGRKQLANGRWPESSNNAYAYSIIER
jgi:hypothetical protein